MSPKYPGSVPSNPEQSSSLRELADSHVGRTEGDVVLRFATPLLERLGYSRDEMSIEHGKLDVSVDVSGKKRWIVVETKRPNVKLDTGLQQLEGYCNRVRPLVAVLTNGNETRIYSPFWKGRRSFARTLLFSFAREELRDVDLVLGLRQVLSKENLESRLAKEAVERREKEIEAAEEEIVHIADEVRYKLEALLSKLDELTKAVQRLKEELDRVSDDSKGLIADVQKETKLRRTPPKEAGLPKGAKGSWFDGYKRRADTPGTQPYRIREYVRKRGAVTFAELKEACVTKLDYVSGKAGSIWAALRALQERGYIRVEGRGEQKRIASLERR
jgi:hypothetical protein